MPIFNRRLRRTKMSVGFKIIYIHSYATLSLEPYSLGDETDLKPADIYGTFRSLSAAKRVLLTLVKQYNFVLSLLIWSKARVRAFLIS